MLDPTQLKLAVRRFLILLAVSVLLVWLGSELAHSLLKDQLDRPPQTITLTIPYGTAVKVEAGLEETTIPSELSFVIGDTLVVYNDDVVAHELGPLFIPAGATASLVMDDTNLYEYTCSFRPSQYLGLDVREATNLNIRLIAISYVSPATAIIIFLYSLALYPLQPETLRKLAKES